MAVITISRQYGSGGDDIAVRVCELLNYRYFDKAMIVDAAAEVGLAEHEVFDISEDRYQARSFLGRLFRAYPSTVARVPTRQRDATGREVLVSRDLEMADCVDLARHAILSAYEMGDIVIIGRGGQAVLRDKPGVLHVRIIAPLDLRIARLRERGITGIADIKATIQQHDRASAEYLQRFFQAQWDDASLYHLVVNTGMMSPETAVQTITAAVNAL